jgi:Tfp pilus assembly protein PilN
MTVINLIPAEIICATARRVRLVRWAVVGALAAVLAAIPYSLTLSRHEDALQLRSELDRLDQEATTVRSQLRLTTSRAQGLLSELERSKALRAKRAWSSMFALIATCLPADCWLLSVATDPETPGVGAPRPAAAPTVPGTAAVHIEDPARRETVTIEAPQKMRFIGFSTSDSQPLVFVGNLSESKAFTRVALQKATRAPDGKDAGEGPLYQFEIVCEW